MLNPITIPAPRDPAAVRVAILDHIAAIDALLYVMPDGITQKMQ